MQNPHKALARYNRLFDNDAYREITQALADDLGVHRETVQESDAVNLVTDAALGLSWLADRVRRFSLTSKKICHTRQALTYFNSLFDNTRYRAVINQLTVYLISQLSYMPHNDSHPHIP